MKLSSVQVKEKLRCGDSTLAQIRDAGILTDLRPRREGAKKHFSLFDSVQVNKVAKVYKPRMNLLTLQDALKQPEASQPVQVEKIVPKKEEKPAIGIITRLDRIEAGINKLVAIWS